MDVQEIPVTIMSRVECLKPASDVTSTASKEQLIRVVLADGHPIVRYGLRELLTLEGDFEVVGEASNACEVVRVVDETRPDVLIVDVGIVNLSELRPLQRAGNTVKVVVLATSEDRNQLFKALKIGCAGVVMKDSASEMIAKMVRRVHASKVLDLVTTTAGMYNSHPNVIASKREQEVIALATRGYTNREIAVNLSISEQTVKNHLHSVYAKYGFSDRLELLLCALGK